MPLGRVPGENAANASLVVRVCEHGKKGGRRRTGNQKQDEQKAAESPCRSNPAELSYYEHPSLVGRRHSYPRTAGASRLSAFLLQLTLRDY